MTRKLASACGYGGNLTPIQPFWLGRRCNNDSSKYEIGNFHRRPAAGDRRDSSRSGADEKFRKIPVIFVTGYVDELEERLQTRFTAPVVVTKPITQDELAAAVHKVLGKRLAP